MIEYRYLGNTGIKVSVIGVGTWQWGSRSDVRERLRGDVNKATVVIFYVPSYEDAEILFVVRSIREDDRWSGQVAFKMVNYAVFY
ncbi:MAG: hypothetical protein QXP74_04215 [Nitrososphaerota archaeon]